MQGRFMLAADIGGTFSRFALFSMQEDSTGLRLMLEPGSKIRLATRDYASFGALLSALRDVPAPGGYTLLAPSPRPGFTLACAALAVPGPVDNGHCFAPNIPWPLSAKEAEAASGAPAGLLNDFAAQGKACLFPQILGLRVILPGESRPDSPCAVLGAGTGLGKAQIMPDPDQRGTPAVPVLAGAKAEQAAYIHLPASALDAAGLEALSARVRPSEGGHAVFPFNGEAEAAYEAFARKMSGRKEIIGDMAVTGYGLTMLYAFHTGQNSLLNPPEVTPLLASAPKALEWLARFYGRACRNFVLETMALGGVYLSGGMLSHVPGLLGHTAFEAEFRQSETQARLMRGVPVQWISNQDAGLWGSAVHGLSMAL